MKGPSHNVTGGALTEDIKEGRLWGDTGYSCHLQARQRGLPKKPAGWHLDLGLTASRADSDTLRCCKHPEAGAWGHWMFFLAGSLGLPPLFSEDRRGLRIVFLPAVVPQGRKEAKTVLLNLMRKRDSKAWEEVWVLRKPSWNSCVSFQCSLVSISPRAASWGPPIGERV